MMPPAPNLSLDEKDHLILSELRKNSRISIRDIAKNTNIRPSTVHQRIQRLIKEKIIEKFTLKLNNLAIAESFIAFILVTSSKDLPPNFIQKKEIKEIFGITGEYDLLIKVKFKDVASFNEFIISFRKQTSITKTLTMIVTTTIKEEL